MFFPALLAITFFTFLLSEMVPGSFLMALAEDGPEQRGGSEKEYKQLKHKLGLDLPFFYFSVSSSAALKNTDSISPFHFENMERLSFNYGNSEATVQYYEWLRKLEQLNKASEQANKTEKLFLIQQLYQQHEEKGINRTIAELETFYTSKDSGFIAFQNFQSTLNKLVEGENNSQKYIPEISWNGFDNRYHAWLFGLAPWFGNDENLSKGILRGDFGYSFKNFRPVSSLIWNAVKWTSLLSLISIFLAYAIAIPLGVISSMRNKYNKISEPLLFVFYSLPDFWVALILIVFLGGGDYFNLFPPTAMSNPGMEQPFWQELVQNLWHLTLPVICLTYSSLAFIVLQLKKSMENSLAQDYILAAKARGLSSRKIYWKHAFKNSLLPMITLFAGILPAIVSGAFIIENIFSIPGMGRLSFYALSTRDYPIVFSVVLLSAVMVLIGYLIADILYVIADPRVKFKQKN
ncbi:MAG: ABC transporter permease [Bacteroidetes bacterium]|nr:ABC transporter permease [Bacteroidota bacterium]